jgi:hypothetical protein
MRVAAHLAATAACVAVALTATVLRAAAEDRSQLVACQAMLDRSTQVAKENGASARPDDTELTRCRQIVREWMLRDARMSVDERGRPMR